MCVFFFFFFLNDFCGIKTTEFGACEYFLIEGPCTEVGCGVIYKQEEDHYVSLSDKADN